MPANRQNNPSFFSGTSLFNNALGIPSYASRESAATSAAQAANSTTAPGNASAAPTKTDKVFTGLCEALNAHQQYLVRSGKYEVADVYSIQFSSPGNLGSFQVVNPGATDLSNTATTNPTTAADKLDSAKGSVNTKSQIWQVTAGTQIVQLIDQIMRSSRYITDQQNVQVSPAVDPKTGLQTVTANPKPGNGTTAWYKITMTATQLKYDNKRKDFAYKMNFIVTPYAITQMASQYFNDSRYRGSHKSYNYWFTGLNTQILNFEQEYNNYYRLTLSGLGKDIAQQTTHDFRDQYRRTYMATSENNTQGQSGYTNEASGSAASFLYSPTDQAKVNLRIVGDPAWMQQGEVGIGVVANAFNFNPFLTDGTINYDSQEVVFDVNFNAPQDYNFSTGIVNVNASNGKPQENFTYTAIRCKNIFSKGRFEQQLEGRLLIEYVKNGSAATQNAGNGRTVPKATQIGNTLSSANSAVSRDTELDEYTTDSLGNTYKNGSLYRTANSDSDPDPNANTTGSDATTASTQPQTTQAAAPPGDPTSTGDIAAIQSVQANYNTSGGGFTPPQDAAAAVAAANENTNAPQQIAQDD